MDQQIWRNSLLVFTYKQQYQLKRRVYQLWHVLLLGDESLSHLGMFETEQLLRLRFALKFFVDAVTSTSATAPVGLPAASDSDPFVLIYLLYYPIQQIDEQWPQMSYVNCLFIISTRTSNNESQTKHPQVANNFDHNGN